MYFWPIQGLIAIVAVLVATGILTVATSTLINGISSTINEAKGVETEVGPTLTYTSDSARALRESVQDFPSILFIMYIVCHLWTFFMLAFLMGASVNKPIDIVGGKINIPGMEGSMAEYAYHLPSVALLSIMIYILFVVIHVVQYKTGLFKIVSSRVNEI